MGVKPILFNTEMVKAILDGRKTCTRRVIKRAIPFDEKAEYRNMLKHGEMKGAICKDLFVKQCSPYQLGDFLYVRETFAWCPCWDCGLDSKEGGCEYEIERIYNEKKFEYGCYVYRASCEDNEHPSADTWHPSIHMPKEAARIWLKVTDVRLERLQDITEKGATEEGCICDIEYALGDSAKGHFSDLWNSTVKKSDLKTYGWDANPYVWVIEFARCEKPKKMWVDRVDLYDEKFFSQCQTCQHCYQKNDDDYVYCRKRKGKCQYKPYNERQISNE